MTRAAVFLALGFALGFALAYLLRPRVRWEPERIDMTPQNSGSGGARHWKGYVSTGTDGMESVRRTARQVRAILNSPSWTRDSSAGFGEAG